MRRAVWSLGLPVRVALLALIALYRVTVGAMFPGRCRFHPSCSAYAEEAIRSHGALKGALLSAWRVLRCSPLSAGGIDPVPARTPRSSTSYDDVVHPPAEYDDVIHEGAS